jgi:hypothetical protein
MLQDLRLVVQVHASDAKVHSMVGIHRWDRCLVHQYPPEGKDRKTHLHVLRKNLWTHLDQLGAYMGCCYLTSVTEVHTNRI